MGRVRRFQGSSDCTASRRVIYGYISRALWTAVQNHCTPLGTTEILSARNLWLKRKMWPAHNSISCVHVLLKTEAFDNVFPHLWLAPHVVIGYQPLYHVLQWRRVEAAVALVSGSTGSGSRLDQGHGVVFLGKILYSYKVSLHPGV